MNLVGLLLLAGCSDSGGATSVKSSVLEGPATFCGYSPIIDLQMGETVTTLEGGIHQGSFRWDGAFGSLVVRGEGWTTRPNGRLVVAPSGEKPGRFAERKREGQHTIAIWNGRQGAAYFETRSRFTDQQLEAIERVRLFQDGEEPSHCDLRTEFAWTIEE